MCIKYDQITKSLCYKKDGEENSSYKELELEEDWLQIWHIEEIFG